MNTLPLLFEERIKKQLPTEAEALIRALQTEPPVSVRLNPGKDGNLAGLTTDVNGAEPVAWCDGAYYLPQRPVFTLDPCFHGGAYYVQEASSMFLAHVLRQILPSGPLRALDLCAAPGGKSTLLASALPPDSLLVSNEVIRSRAAILKENMIKWGQSNVVVTNNDPADFQSLEGAFDLILVDAPCSGEGMFRKDPTAIREWSVDHLRLCSDRQKRILSDIWPSLRPGGLLVYSTCTFNRDENEGIVEWLTATHEATSLAIEHAFSEITPSDAAVYGYHFYPHKTRGEGLFMAVVQKQDGREFWLKKNKKQQQTKAVTLPDELKPLVSRPEQYAFYQTENVLGLLPARHADFIHYLGQHLRPLYQGCELAEMNNRKIKLLHPLALWQGLNQACCTVYPADRLTALNYLKKQDIPAPATGNSEWILITHRNIGLGWCKHIGHRLNNYYPKEWRIRMDIEGTENDSSFSI